MLTVCLDETTNGDRRRTRIGFGGAGARPIRPSLLGGVAITTVYGGFGEPAMAGTAGLAAHTCHPEESSPFVEYPNRGR